MNHFLIFRNNLNIIADSSKLNAFYSIAFNVNNPECIKNGEELIYIIGDFIGDKNLLNNFSQEKIKHFKGNFILIISQGNKLQLISSLFGILPIYYSEDYNYISSDLNWIIKIEKRKLTIDKKFILECLLFNYGFFNRTLYKEVNLLPANSILHLNNDKTYINKYLNIEELFIKDKKTLNAEELSKLFISTSKAYFPKKEFHVAFTSGFDGRTIASCATYHQSNFKLFAFGKKENDDVSIPKVNASELNLPFKFINLGVKEYLNQNYSDAANEYIHLTCGGNGFIYPHILYSAKEIAKESQYLIAGYFGSELFRALHIQGAVSSEALIQLFRTDNDKEITKNISESYALKYLNRIEFEKELKELTEELINYKRKIPSHLSQNEKMYCFVFEEIFRKIFGQWITVQQKYLTVRTPFLDYEFISELLKTKYAGANVDFLTKNPYKRMNGQVIYANIIKKTNPTIYIQKTGKGYRPIDIINKFFLTKLIFAFAFKRIKRKVIHENLDNLSIISGNKSEILKSIDKNFLDQWFKTEEVINSINELNPYVKEKTRDNLLEIASLAIILNKLNIISQKANPNGQNNSLN